MRVAFLETDKDELLTELLPDHVCRPLDPSTGRIEELTEGAEDLVYVVTQGFLDTPRWSVIRAQLAAAQRRFVTFLDDLSTANVMRAVRDGAYDVVWRRDSPSRCAQSIDQAAAAQKLWVQLYGGAPTQHSQTLAGISPAILALRSTIGKIAPADVNVLITGESGVGKEMAARLLHESSRRKAFVAVNCAAIPKDLLESELFGVERGAFTGAVKDRPGWLEQAAGGTLFLDEIGEMDLSLQPKLLRFIETRKARRVGGGREYRVTARLVTATNRELRTEVARGVFRADLFYRLSEISLHLPPLRDRKEDIPELVRRFIDLANERFGKNVEGLDPDLLRRFQDFSWPGNARQLKSEIDRLVLLYDGPFIRDNWWTPPIEALDPEPEASSSPAQSTNSTDESPKPPTSSKDSIALTKADRRQFAAEMLAEGRLNLFEISARLGVHPSTLFRWRKGGRL